MAKKKPAHPKPPRAQTYIKAWRKKLGYTQETLSDALMVQLQYELSAGQISRIETGESPYIQDNVEAIAALLRITVMQLLTVDPNRPTQPLAEFLGLTPERQRQAVALVRALDEKTGTGG